MRSRQSDQSYANRGAKSSANAAVCSSLFFSLPESKEYHSGHENEVNSIRFNPSKTRLASCSDDKTVRIWEVTRYLDDPQRGNVSATVLEGHTDSIASLSWCPNRPEGSHEIIATCVDPFLLISLETWG